MRTVRSKSDEELRVTELVGRLSVKAAFERVTVRSLIISVSIEPVHWTGFQHVWLVATQTEFVNQNVHNIIHFIK